MGEVNIKKVALDTNIFIYYFNKDEKFGAQAKVIFEKLTTGKLHAFTNVLTIVELLSFRQLPKLAARDIESRFRSIPNLTVFEVDYPLAVEAAAIRRDYGFRVPDSIQLATALKARAQVFITNDKRLKRFKELKILLLA